MDPPLQASHRPSIRVAIVDDDVWVRRGRAELLAEVPGIEVPTAVDHRVALESSSLFDGIDVALVDAYDRDGGFDRFPGVNVVRAIRACPRGSEVAIVVVSGHVANDMLRLRMAEAGADLFYGHDDVGDVGHLVEIIRSARFHVRATHLDSASPDHHRIGPDAAITWVRDHRCEAAFSGESQKALPISRRAIMRLRKDMATVMGLGPTAAAPTWRQVSRFVNRARGADIGNPNYRGRLG